MICRASRSGLGTERLPNHVSGLDQLPDVTSAGPPVEPRRAEAVTREAEVLALVQEHRTNAEIASALFISVRTVESHVSSLMRKLQLPDRRSLARRSVEVLLPAVRRCAPRRRCRSCSRRSSAGPPNGTLTAALAEHRLVTATGPGGVGKTRLALSVAAECAANRPDGAWFVDLVQVSDPAMVVAAVADAVGVAEQRGESIEAAVLRALADRDGLLVVDNCEHVIEPARDIIERILEAVPEAHRARHEPGPAVRSVRAGLRRCPDSR